MRLVEGLGLTPSLQAARMGTGPDPEVNLPGLFAVTGLEPG